MLVLIVALNFHIYLNYLFIYERKYSTFVTRFYLWSCYKLVLTLKGFILIRRFLSQFVYYMCI